MSQGLISTIANTNSVAQTITSARSTANGGDGELFVGTSTTGTSFGTPTGSNISVNVAFQSPAQENDYVDFLTNGDVMVKQDFSLRLDFGVVIEKTISGTQTFRGTLSTLRNGVLIPFGSLNGVNNNNRPENGESVSSASEFLTGDIIRVRVSSPGAARLISGFLTIEPLPDGIDEEARQAAADAQTAADAATASARTATDTAQSAGDVAEQARLDAQTATGAANTARTTAGQAQATAITANTAAQSANATAMQAQQDADEAQATADAVRADVNSNDMDIATAQSTANAAALSASNASTVAATATNAAQTAQDDAEAAQIDADAAQRDADTAQQRADAAHANAAANTLALLNIEQIPNDGEEGQVLQRTAGGGLEWADAQSNELPPQVVVTGIPPLLVKAFEVKVIHKLENPAEYITGETASRVPNLAESWMKLFRKENRYVS